MSEGPALARTALYTGSFDPLTNGHVEVIRAAARLCDVLVVAVGRHATKRPTLSHGIRVGLIRAEAGPIVAAAGCVLRVEAFSGLAVTAARDVGATVIVRGLRGSADLDDEMSMAGMNAALAPEVQTVFVPAAPGSRAVTATLVRQIAAMGGDVSRFVPPGVAEALRAARGAGGRRTARARDRVPVLPLSAIHLNFCFALRERMDLQKRTRLVPHENQIWQ